MRRKRSLIVAAVVAAIVGAAVGVIPIASGTAQSTGPFGGPTYVSSVGPANAFDGNAGTYWQGSYNTDLSNAPSPFTATAWTLGYTYSGWQAVTQVEVDYAVDSRFVATAATVACSPDGATWTTVATLPTAQVSTVSLTATCLWVKVVMHDPGTGYTPAVSEVKITSTGTSAPPPSPPPPPGTNPSYPNPTSVNVVGDSITAGSYGPFPYSDLLPIWTSATITNFGVSGNTTELIRDRMSDVLANAPQMVVIMGGTNDCQFGWPTSRSMAALSSIVARVEAAGAEAVLIGPIPRNVTGYTFTPCLLALHDALRDWARANGVPFIDPWPDFESPAGSGMPKPGLLVDGSHPTGCGAYLLARALARGLGWRFAGS